MGSGQAHAVAHVVPTVPPTLSLWTSGCWRGTLATATTPSACRHPCLFYGLAPRHERSGGGAADASRSEATTTAALYCMPLCCRRRYGALPRLAAARPAGPDRCGCAVSPPLLLFGSLRNRARGRHPRSRSVPTIALEWASSDVAEHAAATFFVGAGCLPAALLFAAPRLTLRAAVRAAGALSRRRPTAL